MLSQCDRMGSDPHASGRISFSSSVCALVRIELSNLIIIITYFQWRLDAVRIPATSNWYFLSIANDFGACQKTFIKNRIPFAAMRFIWLHTSGGLNAKCISHALPKRHALASLMTKMTTTMKAATSIRPQNRKF